MVMVYCDNLQITMKCSKCIHTLYHHYSWYGEEEYVFGNTRKRDNGRNNNNN